MCVRVRHRRQERRGGRVSWHSLGSTSLGFPSSRSSSLAPSNSAVSCCHAFMRAPCNISELGQNHLGRCVHSPPHFFSTPPLSMICSNMLIIALSQGRYSIPNSRFDLELSKLRATSMLFATNLRVMSGLMYGPAKYSRVFGTLFTGTGYWGNFLRRTCVGLHCRVLQSSCIDMVLLG